jgi:hypothetical protein
MAASQTEIANLTLTKLGQDRIVSIDDDVEAARVLRSLWDMTRDAVLADHPWRFAMVRTALPALADAPAYEWARQFALPEDCLRLVQVADDWVFYTQESPFYTREGANILCDEAAPLRVRYVKRITNTGLWPVLFARAVAMQLAADACEKLTQSTSKGDKAIGEYELAIRKAKRQNAIELPPQAEPRTGWLQARGD